MSGSGETEELIFNPKEDYSTKISLTSPMHFYCTLFSEFHFLMELVLLFIDIGSNSSVE